MLRSFALAVSLSCIPLVANSHEFWIDPELHQVPPSGTVVAELRVGSEFKGAPQTYLPPRFKRFEFGVGGKTVDVPGRMGDRPAVNLTTNGEGLLVLIHETTDFRLVWDDFQKFRDFVAHKDAMWTLEAHKARGLSEIGVTEAYSRYAKSLIGVGHGRGEDFEAGLEVEIVALENPYTGNTSDGVDVQVLYQGKPRVNEQLEVYEKSPSGDIRIWVQKTDEDGRATVTVKPGHRYMLDSVVLREPDPAKAAAQKVLWESLWANLTFAVPAN